MKYHIQIEFRHRIAQLLVVIALLCMSVCASAADAIPDAPNPPRLVVDYAGIFTPQQVNEMEDSLETFARKTSNRIAVVTMADLQGLEPMEMAYGIGKKWGVGDKKHSAGVVVLVKPKTANGNGDVFIATGYGVEGVLTDAFCSSIIRHEMIPHFRNNDYYSGVVAALTVIKPAMAGELNEEQYLNSGEDDLLASMITIAIMAVILMAVIAIANRRDDSGNNGGNNDGGTWGGGGPIIFGPGFGGGSSSGGSSSFGGGFGGFGGGSFGGGGAGGSW